MALDSVIARIPGLAGYEYSRQQREAQEMANAKMQLTLRQILETQAYRQKALEQQALDRAAGREAAAMNLRAQLEGRAAEGAAGRAQKAADLQERLRAEAALKKELAAGQQATQRQLTEAQLAAKRDIAAGQQATQKEIAAMRQETNPAAIKERNRQEGKQSVKALLDELETDYKSLEKLGSDISPERSAMSNVYNRISSSGAGQLVAGAVGTKSQEVRDSIATKRASLMAAIKEATGMGATQLNSNVELQFYLKMATDPTLSRKANQKAIGWLRDTYGVKTEAPKANGLSADEQKELDALRKRFGR